MARSTGLGKGLNALFAENEITTEKNEIKTLRLTMIEPDPDQHRKTFRQETLNELADSIKLHGLIQPIIVRPLENGNYRIIAGERRWRACRIAGLDEASVIIRDVEEMEAAEMALIENLQREDLNPIDEANGYDRLICDFNITQEEAAKRVGKSRTAITNSLRLLRLPDGVKRLLRDEKISAGHARALLGLDDMSGAKDLCDLIIEKKLSVRAVEKLVKQLNRPKQPVKKDLSREAYIRHTESRLTSELGRRVSIKYSENKAGGSLILEYYDNDDLEEMLSQLCGTDVKNVLKD